MPRPQRSNKCGLCKEAVQGAGDSASRTTPTVTRPHIVLLMTDQQRADTIGAIGARHMITPHMDRLAKEGVVFANAFCPGATCVPSRAAVFTGMYPHNLGCQSFFNWGHHRTWVQDLAEAGYHCTSIGKMHFQPRDVMGGFHDRVVVENPTSVGTWGGHGDDAWGRFLAHHGHSRPNYRHRTDPHWRSRLQDAPWHLEERFHSDVFTADAAVAWIREYSGDSPVFLQVGFPGPHEPWDAPSRIRRLYDNRPIPPPPGIDPNELDEKPPQQRAHQRFLATVDHESTISLAGASVSDLDRMRRAYFAKVTHVDEQIGKVLDALKARDWLDNAFVVLCSDHGELLGEHGLAYKWLMYDSIVRVPLMIRLPGERSGGRTIDQLASLIDLGPTLLDFVGLNIPTRLEGRSLLPLLGGRCDFVRRHVFCEDNYLTMIRDRTHKLVHYAGQKDGELYDLVTDPGETCNRWNDPLLATVRDRLKAELLEWLVSSLYFNSGYRCGEQADYARRWPNLTDTALHGANHTSLGLHRS